MPKKPAAVKPTKKNKFAQGYGVTPPSSYVTLFNEDQWEPNSVD